jgi:2-methylcitrate dehydratase PrpD
MVFRSYEPEEKLAIGDLMRISEFVCSLRLEDISERVVEKVKACLLDALGSMIAGSQTRVGRIARDFASRGIQQQEATVIGSDARVLLQNAAFANGVMASAYDVDDGHRGATGHPGAVIIPAALAIGEYRKASGRELVEALIGGYEIAIRIGESLYSEAGELNGSGRWASVGAAAACSKLLGLDEQTTTQALGTAATFAPVAAPKILRENEAWPMTKESSGWGAMVGLCAALLSEQGLSGPTLLRGLNNAVLTDLGASYKIEQVYFKPYPSCRWTHCAIEAALILKRRHNIQESDIASVRVSTFRRALILSYLRPDTIESAQFSIPFTVGAALALGGVTTNEIAEPQLSNPRILEMADKVHLEHRAEFDVLYPEAVPAEVTIELVDGSNFTKRLDVPKGHFSRSMSRAERLSKFKALSEVQFMNAQKRGLIISHVECLEKSRDISQIMACMRMSCL